MEGLITLSGVFLAPLKQTDYREGREGKLETGEEDAAVVQEKGGGKLDQGGDGGGHEERSQSRCI